MTVNWEHWDISSWMQKPLPETVTAHPDGEEEAFEIRFLEDMLVRLGDQSDLLLQLGFLYTYVGRYRDGLAVDRRWVALRPRDPVAYYNLACSHSLLKQATRAFSALKRAIELGYRDIDHMLADADLENLRQDPRWEDLISVMK